jgi:hypothetical protein
MSRTVNALERGDTRILCSLADQAELATLALTPDKVGRFLRETMWQGGLPRELKATPFPDATDEGVYVWQLRSAGVAASKPVTLTILWTGKGEPKLVLSSLLRSTAIAEAGKVRDGSAAYAEIALRLGIEGLRGGKGQYYDRDHLLRSVSRFKAQVR